MRLRILLADALEHALGAGALDAHGNARIFRLKSLGDLLGERQIDRGVVDDLAFLLAAAISAGVTALGRRRGGAHGRHRRQASSASALEALSRSRRENHPRHRFLLVISGCRVRLIRPAPGSVPAASAATPALPARCCRRPRSRCEAACRRRLRPYNRGALPRKTCRITVAGTTLSLAAGSVARSSIWCWRIDTGVCAFGCNGSPVTRSGTPANSTRGRRRAPCP